MDTEQSKEKNSLEEEKINLETSTVKTPLVDALRSYFSKLPQAISCNINNFDQPFVLETEMGNGQY